MTYEVLDNCGKHVGTVEVNYTANRIPEYWVGWALAYYQWQFVDIMLEI